MFVWLIVSDVRAAWRLQETKRINNSSLSAEDKQAALQQLLFKETKFLQTIDKLKAGAAVDNKDERIQQQLELVRFVFFLSQFTLVPFHIVRLFLHLLVFSFRRVAQMAAPKLWQLVDGKESEVHTPFTIRARELLELYNGLRMGNLSVDERLDVLLHVKWTVKVLKSRSFFILCFSICFVLSAEVA